jgi:hypothetical protein
VCRAATRRRARPVAGSCAQQISTVAGLDTRLFAPVHDPTWPCRPPSPGSSSAARMTRHTIWMPTANRSRSRKLKGGTVSDVVRDESVPAGPGKPGRTPSQARGPLKIRSDRIDHAFLGPARAGPLPDRQRGYWTSSGRWPGRWISWRNRTSYSKLWSTSFLPASSACTAGFWACPGWSSGPGWPRRRGCAGSRWTASRSAGDGSGC